MNTVKRLIKQENLGVIDRTLRLIIGFSLIVPLIVTINALSPALMSGLPFALVTMFYLLLTSMMGWDPFYALISKKSCGGSRWNPCGSYSHQLRTLFNLEAKRDPSYQTTALKPAEHVIGSGSSGNWL